MANAGAGHCILSSLASTLHLHLHGCIGLGRSSELPRPIYTMYEIAVTAFAESRNVAAELRWSQLDVDEGDKHGCPRVKMTMTTHLSTPQLVDDLVLNRI